MPNSQNVREIENESAIDINDIDGAGVIVPGFVEKACRTRDKDFAERMSFRAEQLWDTLPTRDGSSVLVLRDYCLRPWGSQCSRCEKLCPQYAISLQVDKTPGIDQQQCIACGVCVGVCDAFTITHYGLSELYSRIRALALHYGEVVLTCESCLQDDASCAENVVVLPSLAMLSAEFFACLLVERTRLVVAGDFEALFSVPSGGCVAEMIASQAISLAEAWSGRRIGYRETLPGSYEDTMRRSEDGKSRREYFDDLIAHFTGSDNVTTSSYGDARTLYPEALERNRRFSQRQVISGLEVPRVNAFMAGGRLKQQLWPKRRLLLEAFLVAPEMEDRVAQRMSMTDSSRCTDCLACVAACPTKARFAHAHDGLLEYDVRYCFGCGLCEHVCPTQAISLETFIPCPEAT